MSDSAKITNVNEPTEIEKVTFRLATLYDRMAEERDVITKQGMKLVAIIEELETKAEEFKSLKEEIHNSIKNNVAREVKQLSSDLKETWRVSITRELDNSLCGLREACNKSAETIKLQEEERSFWPWALFIALFFGIILFGIIFVRIIMPTPVSPLEHEDLEMYKKGQTLNVILNKVSAKERRELENIYNRKEGKNSK